MQNERCMRCLKGLRERDGYENSVGETLCDDCYGQLWRAKADRPAQGLVEAAMQALHVTRPRTLA